MIDVSVADARPRDPWELSSERRVGCKQVSVRPPETQELCCKLSSTTAKWSSSPASRRRPPSRGTPGPQTQKLTQDRRPVKRRCGTRVQLAALALQRGAGRLRETTQRQRGGQPARPRETRGISHQCTGGNGVPAKARVRAPRNTKRRAEVGALGAASSDAPSRDRICRALRFQIPALTY